VSASEEYPARALLPAGAPLALEKANLQNPSADADIWEKVVRKIGVGAMPPQGSPTPGAAELTKFATALAANLDDAAAKKNYPGRYVLHRLNRTEYANAVRDLLGIEIDPASAYHCGTSRTSSSMPRRADSHSAARSANTRSRSRSMFVISAPARRLSA